jgi:hypothetical protein
VPRVRQLGDRQQHLGDIGPSKAKGPRRSMDEALSENQKLLVTTQNLYE